MRYDAAIIGAGAEGLAAATLLGRAGLRVCVIERSERVGGRCLTREFHPGFRASPFCDRLAAIPQALFWTLGLARSGAVFAAPSAPLAAWPDRARRLSPGAGKALLAEAATVRAAILARVLEEAGESLPWRFASQRRRPPWPGAAWTTQALAAVLEARLHADDDSAAHLAACALEGRVADPFLPGSAVHVPGTGAASASLSGGLGRLAEVLKAAAEEAGVAFSLGLEATDVQRRDRRVAGVGLADGSEIAAAAVISTLDLKRSFLGFFAWNALAKPAMRRVDSFRMAGSTARVLFALDAPPQGVLGDSRGAPIYVAPSLGRFAAADQAWRQAILCDDLPVTLRAVSLADASLAPSGGAVVTASLDAVPFRLFDGAWTFEKRELLRKQALRAAHALDPGFAERVVACEVVAPPDIEDGLGATEGDLAGGEVAPDQILGPGPWREPALPRTPVAGFYLAGSFLTAGAWATCAAGAAAARALLVDRAAGRLR